MELNKEDLIYIRSMNHNYLKQLGIKLDKKNGKKFTLNKRKTTFRKTENIYYKGQYYTLKELSKIYGMKKTTLASRLLTYGWSVEKALHQNVKVKYELAYKSS